MSEWGAVRMATPFGQIYIARTEYDFAYLKRRPREDGEPRVVFTLEEFGQLFQDCEEKNLTPQERLEFFAEIRAIKIELGGTFEKIGTPEEFPEGDTVDLDLHKQELEIAEKRQRSKKSKTCNGRKEVEADSASGDGTTGDNAVNLGLAY